MFSFVFRQRPMVNHDLVDDPHRARLRAQLVRERLDQCLGVREHQVRLAATGVQDRACDLRDRWIVVVVVRCWSPGSG